VLAFAEGVVKIGLARLKTGWQSCQHFVYSSFSNCQHFSKLANIFLTAPLGNGNTFLCLPTRF